MSEPRSSEHFQVEYTDEAKRFLYRRRASTHAAFFLPYLQPGMRLLDCGCGPGSITVDLAVLVAPGEVIGIDLDPAQLALAQAHAESAGVTNVRFEQGDVRQLRYEDQSFDAAFVHGVIEYLPDPVQAFAEIRRVLNDTGVLGTRHSDWGAFLFAPAMPVASRFFELFQKYMRDCGGEPEFGRHQLAAVRAAGFTRIRPSASCDCWTTDANTTRFAANFLATYTVSAEFAEPLAKLNLASKVELQAISDALRLWGEHPDAFAAEPWGEAVAWRS
jgi:SAM-dependent methyltransferase